MSVFWNSFTANSGKYRESQTTSFYSLPADKNFTTVTFVEVFREKRMFHNFENSEKIPLQNIFLTLQAFFKVKTYFTALLFGTIKGQ